MTPSATWAIRQRQTFGGQHRCEGGVEALTLVGDEGGWISVDLSALEGQIGRVHDLGDCRSDLLDEEVEPWGGEWKSVGLSEPQLLGRGGEPEGCKPSGGGSPGELPSDVEVATVFDEHHSLRSPNRPSSSFPSLTNFAGVEGGGGSFRIDQAAIVHLRQGKIAEAWEVADIAALHEQVAGGLTPGP